MNDLEPRPESPEDTARNSLKEIIKSSKYEHYADSRILLTEELLDQEILDSEKFIEVKDKYGWPDSIDAKAIKTGLRLEYGNDMDFLYCLRISPAQHLQEIPGLSAEEQQAYKKRYLNNFNVWLRTKPSDTINPDDMLEATHSFQPALHRGYVIAPDLLENLQIFFSSVRKKTGNGENLTTLLTQPENRDVVTGAHIAYKLLGRLFKLEDQYIQMKNMYGDDHGAKPVYDIHTALTS